jgi:hypothetical protein
MNNNVGSVEVAANTKHRDPKSLLGYIRKKIILLKLLHLVSLML